MNQLVWTIIGIGLIAAIFAAGQSYVSTDGAVQSEVRQKVVLGFHRMIAAYTDYRTANGTPPALASWQTQLVPAYTTLPVPISGLSWSYGNDATYGDYFCLSGSVTIAQNTGIQNINPASTTYFPANLLVIAYNACGKRSTDSLGATPTSWPASIYITYWLAGA